MSSKSLTIRFIDSDFEVSDLKHPAWNSAEKLDISTYWNAQTAPETRQFAATALWSERYLYIQFETPRGKDMTVSDSPQTDQKTIGLWERDVCEIFVAPDRKHPEKYFEFEIAPTGEWLDLAIDLRGRERNTNWSYRSGMEAAACIEERLIIMAIKIPFKAFGYKPIKGDVWLGNLFRCVGREPARGYLAWCPTMTETPNFHVPESFGRLIFDNQT